MNTKTRSFNCSLVRYYSNFISDVGEINPTSKIYYDNGELKADSVLTEELEYKKITYKGRKNHCDLD